MGALRKVELTDAADEQVVRIPADLKLPASEAVIHREGNRIVLEALQTPAASNRRLADWLATLTPTDEDFGSIDDLPPEPVTI